MVCDFVVIVPAFNPDETIISLVEKLVGAGSPVIVVDDGSRSECRSLFDRLGRFPDVTILRHAVNLGKGAALKTAMNHAAVHFPEKAGVVTADADGQHSVEDVLRVGARLEADPAAIILGVRRFQGNVPVRCRVGNAVTRHIFHFLTGLKLSDTQTGLRGIPMPYVPSYLRILPNRYEFEMELLIKSKRYGHPIVELPIATIYRDDNRGSHFNPLLDSLRIYFVLFRFVFSSVLAACLDYVIFMACYALTLNILLSQYVARAISGSFNYAVNRRKVFYSYQRVRTSFPKYVLLAAFLAFCSYLLIENLVFVGLPVAVAKPIAEAALFVVSFSIQRSLVFAVWSNEDEP